jgi:hypothetical protein
MVQLWKILGVSRFLLTVRRSLRRSWTSWRLKRIAKRQQKAVQRALLLQLELESQLLQCKELEQEEQLLLHRQQETLESEAFHNPPAKLERPPLNLLE